MKFLGFHYEIGLRAFPGVVSVCSLASNSNQGLTLDEKAKQDVKKFFSYVWNQIIISVNNNLI